MVVGKYDHRTFRSSEKIYKFKALWSPSSIFPLILRPTRYRGSSYQSSDSPLFCTPPLYSRRTRKQRVPLSLFFHAAHTLAGYSIYLLSRPPTRGVRPVWTFLPCVIYYPARTRLARRRRRRRRCPSFTHVHQPLLTTTGLLVSLSLARAHAPTRTHMHSHTHIHTHQQPLDIPCDHPVSYHASFSSGTHSFSFNARRLTLI